MFATSAIRPRMLVSALLFAGIGLTAGGCSSVSDSTRGFLRSVTPYKVEVVQGNFVSKEQVAALQTGMSRQQVREILGTSLLADVFHKDRWDYVFTIQRQGVPPQQRHLALFFDGEALARIEGDEMPSEQEFVSQLAVKKSSGNVPQLELTDEEVQKLDAARETRKDKPVEGAEASDASAPRPPLPSSYPPLEGAR